MLRSDKHPANNISNDLTLGVDVGSATVRCVLLDNHDEILKTLYETHHGNITGCLQRLLSEMLLKIFHLLDHYPDIRLFVHVNPIFCYPALVSESLFKKIEQDTGVPVVSITYDGTQTPHNRILMPYLHFMKEGVDHGQGLSSVME